MSKRYSMSYEGGKCPFGFEYVEGFGRSDGSYIRPYCRRLKKRRFTDPLSKTDVDDIWP